MDKPFDLEELWSVFGEESKENLDLVESCLLKLDKTPTDVELVAALFRSMHTVKGGARMMGLSVLESLAHHAEDLISLVRDEGVPLDSEIIALLLSVCDQLRLLLDEVLAQRKDVEPRRVEELVKALVDLADRRTGRTQAGGESAGEVCNAECMNSGAGAEIEEPASEAVENAEVTPEEPAAETETPLFIFEETQPQPELIDLSTDPVSIRIFFEMADDELNAIRAGLETFFEGEDQEIGDRLSASADSLAYASSQMGFARLEQSAQDFLNALGTDENGQKTLVRERIESLEQEMRDLHQRYAEPEPLAADSPVEERPASSSNERPGEEALVSSGFSTRVLQSFMETIGEMAGDHTTLHHLLMRLYRTDLISDVKQILKVNSGDPQELARSLETYLSGWVETVSESMQVENKVSASLSHLQELCGELGVSLERTIVDGMVVRIGRVFYLIPINAVRRITSATADTLVHSSADGHRLLLRVEDQMLLVHDLSGTDQEIDINQLMVVIDGAHGSFAVRVDELLGQQRLLVLPLKGQLTQVRHVVGCVLLGEGEVGMVLNPDSIGVA